MCGIFGWVPAVNKQHYAASSIAQHQIRTLRHRGPNDSGYCIFPVDMISPPNTERTPPTDQPFRLMLGQTRLSIIDLSAAGHQPMRTTDGRYTIVYNGEVYNYKELRSELEALGIVFHTNTDTEVVLNALIYWGKDGLQRFTGMFAFALFDAERNTLLCARDAFGIKPFFWHMGEMGFCFASEIPALLQFPYVPRRVSPHGAYQYLCNGHYDAGDTTMLSEVYALPAGHYFEYDIQHPQAIQSTAYWRPNPHTTSELSFSDAADTLRELFLDSVRLHLRSDVPLGVALSGGIDSSAVCCAVRHLEPDADLHTFSFIAENSPLSEEVWIDLVARETRAVQHKVIVAPHELVADLDAMITAQGEPFGSTSIYAQYRVFKLAKECGITVTLDGQGADELLAGYYGYPGPRTASLICAGSVFQAGKFLHACHQWPDRTWKYLFHHTVHEFVPHWLTPLARQCVGRSPNPNWLDTQALQDAGVRLFVHDIRKQLYPTREKLKQTLAYHLTWFGLPHLLRHGDRNAMAHSIESRVPFLTKEMADFCMSLPEHYLVDMQGCSKSVFRQAMRGIVPDTVLDRRDKIGFATPEQDWLKMLSTWVDSTLAEAQNIPFMHVDIARKEWQAIHAGKAPFDWRVWRWLCYTRWVQLFDIRQ